MEKPKLPLSLLETIPWNEKQDILPASLIILRRNLAKYHFPSKMHASEALQPFNSLKNKLLQLPEMAGATFLLENEMSPNDRELLFEHFLFTRDFEEKPNGSGFIIDPNSSLLAVLNRGNHLELCLLDLRGNLEESWSLLSRIETQLSESLDFAYSPKFGYLTSDPSYCGTGLSFYTFLHVPALVHTEQLQDILSKQLDENVVAFGLLGSLDQLVGDIIALENNFTLGLTEESNLHALQTMANKLIPAEKALRAHIKQTNNPAIKDQVSKAYGLLLHSYQLEVKEALNYLSLIKLGINLGWIEGITEKKIQELFFKCRRGHLTHLFAEEIDQKEIAHKRAEYLHQELKSAVLKASEFSNG